ncbi:MAG: O-antigen ligase family protein [Bacteroidales bacterium]|nr:O-antigen ligase family protein [Bacteroidales bacterium]
MLNPKELLSDNPHFNVLCMLLLLALATLPFTNWLLLPIAVAMVVNWVWEWNWKEKINNLRDRATLPAVLIFSSLYLLTILGFLISSNKDVALTEFDCDLLFLVAPIVILSYKPELFTPARMRLLFGIFVVSCILQCLIIVPLGIYRVVVSGNNKYLYYIFLSIFKHPTYVAMYMTFALFLLLKDSLDHWTTTTKAYRITAIAASALLFLTIILLQSKAGLICIALLSIIWIFYYFAIRLRKPIQSLLVMAAVAGCAFLVYQSGIIGNNRAQDTIEQLKTHQKNDSSGKGSSEIRLTIWKCAWEVSLKHLPWGTGTGDAIEDMKLNALEKNYTNLLKHSYNAHCQYIQELMETGIVGLIVIVVYCLFTMIESFRKKSIVYVTFALLVMLNISVECMFEVRSGVAFIAITNVLLWRMDNTQEKINN